MYADGYLNDNNLAKFLRDRKCRPPKQSRENQHDPIQYNCWGGGVLSIF